MRLSVRIVSNEVCVSEEKFSHGSRLRSWKKLSHGSRLRSRKLFHQFSITSKYFFPTGTRGRKVQGGKGTALGENQTKNKRLPWKTTAPKACNQCYHYARACQLLPKRSADGSLKGPLRCASHPTVLASCSQKGARMDPTRGHPGAHHTPQS